MLGLLIPTPTEWVHAAEQDLPGLLDDHAHCELKAAQSALSIVGRFGGDFPELVAPLLELAQEETEHFRQVHARAKGPLSSPAPDDYVGALRKAARRDGKNVHPLLDRLLVCALIEARSCERFKLLSEHLASRELRAFYAELMVSEARHYRLFCSLAESCFGTDTARARLETLARREGNVAAQLPLGPSVHG